MTEAKKAEVAIAAAAPPVKDIQTLMVNGVSMDIDMDTSNVQLSRKGADDEDDEEIQRLKRQMRNGNFVEAKH